MMLLIIPFIWKAQLVKGEFLKEYCSIRDELKEQDGPVWFLNTSPNLYNYGRNFFVYNFQLSFIRLQSSPYDHPQTPL